MPSYPWEKLAVDIKGPLQSGPKYLLVVVDYYSKWPEVFALDSISTKRIIRVLSKLFGRMGYPSTLVTDNGTQLVSKKLKDWLSSHGVNQYKTALYTPA